MITIPNYEVAQIQLPGPEGIPLPAVALSFNWEDARLPGPPNWTESAMSLALVKEGLAVALPDGQSLLFPLGQVPVEGGPAQRAMVQEMIQAVGGVHVCAFGRDGALLASMGFQLDPGPSRPAPARA